MIRQSRLANFALLLLATLLFTVFISDDSEAATITVDKFGGADYTNITQAVDNASASDTIKVATRTYHDAVEVDKKLTILGGNEGVDAGAIFDPSCNSGELVARYRLDENGGSDIDDDIWCDDLDGDVEGASWATGVWESGLDFDGSNDYVKIDDDDAFDITGDISIAAWVNLDDNESRTYIINKWTSDTGYYFSILSNGKLQFKYDDSTCNTDTVLSEDRWYFLGATMDSGTSKIYINGALDKTCNSSDTSISANSLDLWIGSGSSSEYFMDGTIDDVGIWNIALSASNIEGLYWSGNGSYYPIVNARGGGYYFQITAEVVTL